MQALEEVLSHLSLFEHLRPDEIGRVARHFHTETLAEGERRDYTTDNQRMVVVVGGRVSLGNEEGTVARLEPGDRHGELALLTGHVQPFHILADRPATIATVDRAAFDAILEQTPAVALPLADELSRELRARNDAVRQLLELHAERLPKAELAAAVAERRNALARRGTRVRRLSPQAIFRRLVVQEGAEPPFWMLTGFIAALGGARLVVFLILKYHLEKQLFALVQGTDPNPMHVHHFNYGLVLAGTAGLAALFPFGRRALRALAFVFGAGVGLIFDEFSLLWNLNPEYANPSSLIASGLIAGLLLQVTYFRQFWRALARRAWLGLSGDR